MILDIWLVFYAPGIVGESSSRELVGIFSTVSSLEVLCWCKNKSCRKMLMCQFSGRGIPGRHFPIRLLLIFAGFQLLKET